MATIQKPVRPVKPEVQMMRVRATARGHDNVEIREEGDEFLMPVDSFAPWFHPVDPADKARTDKLMKEDDEKRAYAANESERLRQAVAKLA